MKDEKITVRLRYQPPSSGTEVEGIEGDDGEEFDRATVMMGVLEVNATTDVSEVLESLGANSLAVWDSGRNYAVSGYKTRGRLDDNVTYNVRSENPETTKRVMGAF